MRRGAAGGTCRKTFLLLVQGSSPPPPPPPPFPRLLTAVLVKHDQALISRRPGDIRPHRRGSRYVGGGQMRKSAVESLSSAVYVQRGGANPSCRGRHRPPAQQTPPPPSHLPVTQTVTPPPSFLSKPSGSEARSADSARSSVRSVCRLLWGFPLLAADSTRFVVS